METRWMYHTSATLPEILEASKGTCIIPIGCVEKHGLHMPLGTDTMAASHTVYEASQIEPVCVFPDFIFGAIPTRKEKHNLGNVTLPLSTLLLLLEQLCDQISQNGFKKILLYNGHGGNCAWISAFLQDIDNRNKDYVVTAITVDEEAPFKMADYIVKNGSGSIPELTPEDEADLLKCKELNIVYGHACYGEAAVMTDMHPELIRYDLLGKESGVHTHDSDKYNAVDLQVRDGGWNLEFPNAYAGEFPVYPNARIARAAVRLAAERVARAVKVLKEDKDLLKGIG